MRKRGHHHPNKRVFVQVTTGHDRHVILRNNTRSKRRSSTSMHPRTLGRPRDKHQNYIQNELRSKHQNYIQNELRSLQAFIKVWPSPRNNTQLGGDGNDEKESLLPGDQERSNDTEKKTAPTQAPASGADKKSDKKSDMLSKTKEWDNIYKEFPHQSMVAIYYRMISLYDLMCKKSFISNLENFLRDANFTIDVKDTDITVTFNDKPVTYNIKVIDEIIKDTQKGGTKRWWSRK